MAIKMLRKNDKKNLI